MAASRTFRLGSRGSKLARWQSDWVGARLRERGVAVEVIEITTTGDVQQSGPVTNIGGQGVFTKEIQAALLAGTVDFAVHSLKDLPTASAPSLVLAAIPEREDVADALVAREGHKLADLPQGAVVGTGSLRRRAQLLALRPDLRLQEIRGNVDTRLRKLDEGQYDAIVLAAAGLNRLGLDARITELLAPPRMLPAPGQGALAIECRSDDPEAMQPLAPLDHAATRAAVVAEREVLAALHGGCSAPIAAWGRTVDGMLELDGLVASLDGTRVLKARATSAADESAEVLGRQVAEALLAQGAAELVAAARAM
jgi:hydroxymethylbilane synthase